jgi:tetratricopeptide (TPR) repeat protein
MSDAPRADGAPPDEPPPAEPGPDEAQHDDAAPGGMAPPDDGESVQLIDLVADELTLARAQLDAGQPALAEGTVLRRLAWLEADGGGAMDEADALRALLAEALWRQGRWLAARRALDAIRPGSAQRRLPRTLVIEADALAAAGERDRAAGVLERVIDAIGVDAAYDLRGAMAGPLSWPLPSELLPQPSRPSRAPWAASDAAEEPRPEPASTTDERMAAGRARLEEARVAYVAGDLERGDAEMAIAVRLEPGLAADGVAILEPTLGAQPSAERLLLYGDLLRAAGRRVEANETYDRAVGRRS